MHQKLVSRIILTFLLLLAGCGRQEDSAGDRNSSSSKSESPEQKVFHVFSFDGALGNRYLMHFEGPGRGATIFTHNETRHLQLTPTASGTRYADDRLMVWLQGDDVIMEVDGKRVGPCEVSGLQQILARAWLGGTEFWAVGNEPGWNLVMGRERVVLLTDTGQTRQEFPGLEDSRLDPRSPAGTYVFSAENSHLKVEILEGLCTNIMSGEPFAVSVKITLDGKEMTGCGTGLF